MDHKVLGAAKDHLDLEATWDLQALDRKEIKVCLSVGVLNY